MVQDAITISYNYVKDISSKIYKAIDPSHGIIDLKSAQAYVEELQDYLGASPTGIDEVYKKIPKLFLSISIGRPASEI